MFITATLPKLNWHKAEMLQGHNRMVDWGFFLLALLFLIYKIIYCKHAKESTADFLTNTNKC